MAFRDPINIDDLKAAARQHMPRAVFDFIEGGVDDELGIARMRAAYEDMCLVPRVGRNVSKTSTASTIFGQQFSAPFGIAPMGLADLFRRGADMSLARAAAAADIPLGLSAASSSSMERVAPVAGGRLWYQIYGTKDRQIMDHMIGRAAALGVKTIFLTLDVPIDARRERNLRNRFTVPYRPTPAAIAETLLHPHWLWAYFRAGGMPVLENWVPYAPANASAREVAAFFKQQTPDPTQDWDDVKRVRDLWKGNLLVKGVLHPDDAVTARNMGADGIVISTHGGRQMDRAPAPLSCVGPIRRAVGDDMTIIVDGGIRRGADIVCALAAGANFTLVGRSALYGAIAGGDAGALTAVNMLKNEVLATMTQLGSRDATELNGDFIRPTN
ncbi:MAG: alpha-hydroxy acid oxidase [Mesorhizobium sp.]